jgi:hypothetical protein
MIPLSTATGILSTPGYQTVNVPRNVMRLTMTLHEGPSAGYRSRSNFLIGNQPPVQLDFSTVNEAVKTEFKRVVGLIGSSYLLKAPAESVNLPNFIQYYKFDQTAAFVRGDYRGWGNGVQDVFFRANRQRANVYLIRVVQPYYTVEVDNNLPLTSGTVAGDPVYVRSVTYGRIGYFRIESDEPRDAVRLSWQRDARTGPDRMGFVYDGTTANPQPMTSSLAFSDWFERQNGVRISRIGVDAPAVPIYYELAYVRDRAPAYSSFHANYTEQVCQPKKYLSLRLNGISLYERMDKPVWGFIEATVRNTQSGIILAPVEPYGPASMLWQATQRRGAVFATSGLQGGINNINLTYKYLLPRGTSAIDMQVEMRVNLDVVHKDNDFASEGWHGMGRVETKTVRIGRTLPGQGFYIMAGPYNSHPKSDRNHQFNVQFVATQ